MGAGACDEGSGHVPPARRGPIGTPTSATVPGTALGGLAATARRTDPSLVRAVDVTARTTSLLKPTPEPAPQADSAALAARSPSLIGPQRANVANAD
ncbi:hypothetical protein AB0G02_31070, partial [Actinosynnema sp. NPDC023658]|uniref:hypothetical protein n=1 Tax=Actinosynnema sp. NPDC023658 TaxID=3155465 RepID=UPI0033EB4C34